MKLQELAVANPTKQAAKVLESYFGNQVSFDTLSHKKANSMLQRVRSLIAEHRKTPEFHRSEQNPAYLKLVVMEQALAAKVSEEQVGMATINTAAGTGAMVDPMKTAALQTAQQQQKKRQMQDTIKQKQQARVALDKEIQDLQRQMNSPMESKIARRLREASEVQQAQVVLASQDMVDQVQKMSEQVSAMQFKDLPALVDSIKNEVGQEQATQFNTDATAALTGLLQNLQGAKAQLETALGVVTGQAPVVPGQDMTGMAPAELPAPDAEVDVDVDADIEEPSDLESSLGRGRR